MRYIIYNKASNTLIVRSYGVVEKGIVVNANVIAGRGACFWGGIDSPGEVSIGRGCLVKGTIKAKRGIIGARSSVRRVEVEEDLKIFDYCKIDEVIAGGDVYIRKGSVINTVKAGKKVILDGMSKISDIKAGERVIALDSDKM